MPGRLAWALTVSALIAACGSPSIPGTGISPSPTVTTSPTTGSPPAASPRPAAPGNDAAFDLEIPVAQLPRDLAIHDGEVWVANARSGSVWAIDPVTGEVATRITTGPRPISLASLHEQLWVSVLGPGSGIIGRGIARLDPGSATVAQEVEVPVQHGLAAADGSVWVLDGERHVQRVDPDSGSITATIDVGGRPVAIDADGRWAWLIREDGTTVRIDVASDTVTTEADTGAPAPGRSAVLVVDDQVWIAVTDRIHVLDADQATVTATIEVEGLSGTTGIAADQRSVWLASTVMPPGSALTEGRVLRLDRSTFEIGAQFDVAGEPAGLALDGSTVWVADQERNVVLRLPGETR